MEEVEPEPFHEDKGRAFPRSKDSLSATHELSFSLCLGSCMSLWKTGGLMSVSTTRWRNSKSPPSMSEVQSIFTPLVSPSYRAMTHAMIILWACFPSSVKVAG